MLIVMVKCSGDICRRQYGDILSWTLWKMAFLVGDRRVKLIPIDCINNALGSCTFVDEIRSYLQSFNEYEHLKVMLFIVWLCYAS